MAASRRLRTYWLGRFIGVDLAGGQRGQRRGGHGGVAGGVGGRQVDRVAAAGELGGDEVGDGGLADPTLAGDEDHAVSRPLELVDEPSQAPTCWRAAPAPASRWPASGGLAPMTKARSAPTPMRSPATSGTTAMGSRCNDEGCVLKACCWAAA